VVGKPTNLDQSDTYTTHAVLKLIDSLKSAFPSIPVEEEDERMTSRIAKQSMIMGGMKKKKRRDKGNVDKISAAIILQSFLKRTGDNF
jgi:putative Holliday junction resolvase